MRWEKGTISQVFVMKRAPITYAPSPQLVYHKSPQKAIHKDDWWSYALQRGQSPPSASSIIPDHRMLRNGSVLFGGTALIVNDATSFES